jgi:hypothetical protein
MDFKHLLRSLWQSGRVRVYKVNDHNGSQTPSCYQHQRHPTQLLFKNKESHNLGRRQEQEYQRNMNNKRM